MKDCVKCEGECKCSIISNLLPETRDSSTDAIKRLLRIRSKVAPEEDDLLNNLLDHSSEITHSEASKSHEQEKALWELKLFDQAEKIRRLEQELADERSKNCKLAEVFLHFQHSIDQKMEIALSEGIERMREVWKRSLEKTT